jgi:hypothetical protein
MLDKEILDKEILNKEKALGKKKHANDFSLRCTCYWQVGQLINFLFSYTALYNAISSRLAVNWQVRQLISN